MQVLLQVVFVMSCLCSRLEFACSASQVVFVISWFALPTEFTGIFSAEPDRIVKNWYMFFCVAVGLWGGLIIGIATEYFTSNRYRPVQVCHFHTVLLADTPYSQLAQR